jgi:hypothetical protein
VRRTQCTDLVPLTRRCDQCTARNYDIEDGLEPEPGLVCEGGRWFSEGPPPEQRRRSLLSYGCGDDE